jgi:HSP20 family protein
MATPPREKETNQQPRETGQGRESKTPSAEPRGQQQAGLDRPSESTLAPPRRGSQGQMTGWEPIRRMREEFDRMFDQYIRGWPAALWEGAGDGWRWNLDLQEDDNAVHIRAEAPGFEPGDFDIQIRGDTLVIRAAHKNETEEKEGGYRGWQSQEFFRSVRLPAETDAGKVKASYRQGVLTLTLPKSETARAHRIAVEG